MFDTEEQMRKFARAVIEEDAAYREEREKAMQKRLLDSVLIMLGIDPYATDEQISKDLKEFRSSIAHSAWWLNSINQGRKAGITTIVTMIVAGIFGAIVLGIQAKFHLGG